MRRTKKGASPLLPWQKEQRARARLSGPALAYFSDQPSIILRLLALLVAMVESIISPQQVQVQASKDLTKS